MDTIIKHKENYDNRKDTSTTLYIKIDYEDINGKRVPSAFKYIILPRNNALSDNEIVKKLGIHSVNSKLGIIVSKKHNIRRIALYQPQSYDIPKSKGFAFIAFEYEIPVVKVCSPMFNNPGVLNIFDNQYYDPTYINLLTNEKFLSKKPRKVKPQYRPYEYPVSSAVLIETNQMLR